MTELLPIAAGGESPGAWNSLREVTVILPARNEEQALGHVLDELPRVGQVIVVDKWFHGSNG